MRALYNQITRGLDGESTIDVSTGSIVEPAPVLGDVLRTTRAKKREELKERKD